MPPKLRLITADGADTGVTPAPTASQEDNLDGYEPLFLSTKDMVDAYWPQVEAVIRPVIDRAMHGEMTINDIYAGVCAGQMYCLVFKDDSGELPVVALALILELAAFPQITMLNVTAVGGRKLNLFQSRFWKHICSWAYMNGARGVQAMVSPAMARILKSYGFSPVYSVMRLSLTEM